MSSIQERLQLKRVPIDTWNIREQLCLASAVVRSGDQNWMSVSRALKTVGEPNRPPDWYSQKSCAAQYGALLEHVETPKRKKRSSEGAGETPQESIVKRLTEERIVEIQKTIAEMNQQYDQLKNEILEVRNPATSEDRLREIWSSIESAKRARERETARRAAWLKEREERRARVDRTWRPTQPTTPTSPAAPAPPSSPLLTSLLKSSPVVTTPQHITHPANVVDTLSPSVQAPTLSMLLEKTPQHESKHAAIEHIKSQLVQIEQQLKASSTPSTPLPAPAPAVDIDDIEIKEEDVYVFRDIDLHIPQVNNIHKQRSADKTPTKKDDEPELPVDNVPTEEVIKEEQMAIEEVTEESHVEVEIERQQPEVTPMEVDEQEVMTETPEPVKIAFPEVKFPTTEIKVIQPDEVKIKDEKEPEVTLPEVKVPEVTVPEVTLPELTLPVVAQPEVTQPELEEAPQVEEEVVVHEEEPITETVTEDVSSTDPIPSTEAVPSPEPVSEPVPEPIPQPEPISEQIDEQIEREMEQIHAPTEPEVKLEVTDPQDIPLPPEPMAEEPPLPQEEPQAQAPPEPEPEVEVKPEVTDQEVKVEVSAVEEKTEDEVKKDEDEDSIPLNQMLRDEALRHEQREVKTEETHTETDDDTPMELSREEEKDGKKKRDYSRKKKPDSRTCSGSESAAEASAPESPSASDAERQHRLWKKSVMLVYSRLCAHKYASLFLRPISDDEAPGYSVVVKRPMDLTTIRRNIENGVIRTTAEFQRDVLLMLSNALMYNSSEHSVYTMAKEMHEEASGQLGMLLAAQAHAGLLAAPHNTRKPRRDHRNRH